MTAVNDARLRSLLTGPWATASKNATKFLHPPAGLVSALLAKKNITSEDLKAAEEAKATKKRSEEIRTVLRAHWETEDGVYEDEEIETRDSMDEALTTLQLLELSVESGYLPEDVVQEVARKRLLELLWSKGARAFVRHYDYIGVRFLAARCGVGLGLRAVTPPEPDPRAQVQFATFLSQHNSWYGDDGLDWWVGLLDDYVGGSDEFDEPEGKAFRRFLLTKKLPSMNPKRKRLYYESVKQRFYERAAGLQQFLSLLSNLYSFLPEETAHIYGSMYLYWMAKFFGYGIGDDGYERDEEDDWSSAAAGPVLSGTKARKDMIRDQIAIIRGGFDATKAFVTKHL